MESCPLCARDELLRSGAGEFEGVVVSDVLYLLPFAAWPGFLRACRSLLRPSGLLLLKEAEANLSWHCDLYR